ncbi:MAG: T9SS type A sorting domain-containing protein [bacterium]|nr:T9SS type A sorting domain-containing protein [bacterium]
MKVRRLRIPLFVILCVSSLFAVSSSFAQRADTIRVMAYNILNYPGSDGAARAVYLRKTLNAADIDILVAGEVISYAGVVLVRDNALNAYGGTDWAYAPFVDGRDTDAGFFYRQSKLVYMGMETIPTELRNIYVYKVHPIHQDTTSAFYVYYAHLKASNSSDDAAQRGRESTIMRNHANALPTGSRFMYTGDFNLYTSAEVTYSNLTGSQADNDGRAFDPLQPGNWSNNSSFRFIHTQSPRVRSFGGGTTGGMDDRFDFILPSMTFNTQTGSRYITNSFRTYGNDGSHFNDSINSRPNTAVPDSIADALHYAADHLPVYADFIIVQNNNATPEPPTAPMPSAITVNAYPNPFNSEIKVQIDLVKSTSITATIIDMSGREIGQITSGNYAAGSHLLTWHAPGNLTSGTYYIRVRDLAGYSNTVPVQYVK